MEAHTEAVAGSLTTTSEASNRLAVNALSTMGVLFCIVTGCAPMAAMQFNVPVTVNGAGSASPSAYLIAAVVLTVWSVGYVEMAKHVTAAGGFYTFISHAFGRVIGLGAALLVTLCYLFFVPPNVGVAAYFASGLLSSWFSLSVQAWVLSLILIAVVAALSFFHIELTSKVLGVFLVTEVVGLLVFDFAVLFQGGRHGLVPHTFSPSYLLSDSNGAKSVFGTGAVGIAMFGAFWSWTGFEMAPNYAEESRNPKRLVGPATYFAVLGVGFIYILTAWMFVAGWGTVNQPNSPNPLNWSAPQAVASQYGLTKTPLPHGYSSAFYPLTDQYVGHLMTNVFQLLMVTGTFACIMAFFNTSSRYLFSLGRERIIPSAFGKTHPKHHSPYVANLFTAFFTLCVFAAFEYHNHSTLASLTQLGTWPSLLGVFGLLLIMTGCVLGVTKYFLVNLKPGERGGWSWPLRVIVCPLIGAAGCIVASVLIIQNRTVLGGGNNLFIKLFPWVVVATFVIGCLLALYWRSSDRERYDAIGRFVHSEI
jgi:amino acid transporter